MGFLFYLVLVIILLAITSVSILRYLERCDHKWKLIESGHIWRGSQKNVRGWVKVYECEHCKKMKKEQLEID